MGGDLVNTCVGDFVSLQRGNTYKSKLLDLPGPYLLGLASIAKEGGFRKDKLKTYGGPSAEKLLLYPGDIYVSLKDVTQSGDLLGAVARVPTEIPIGRLTQDTVKLNFNNHDIPTDYLYWILRTPQYRAYCRARAMGTTNLSLSRNDFLSFPVSKINDARERIITTLEAIERKIELNSKINQTIEIVSQTIFKSWFIDFEPVKAKAHIRKLGGNISQIERAAQAAISGAVNFQDIVSCSSLADIDKEISARLGEKCGDQSSDQSNKIQETAKQFSNKIVTSDLGLIPEGWKSISLSEIIELKYGKALKKNNRRKGSIPVFGSGGKIDSHDEYLVKGPGIIVARKGSVGNIFWADEKFFPIDTTFYVSAVTEIHLFWVYMQLGTIDILSLSSDSAVPGVNRNALLSQEIILPCHSLIEKYIDLVTPFIQFRRMNIDENTSLSSLRDELLPRLLSGDIFASDSIIQTERQ